MNRSEHAFFLCKLIDYQLSGLSTESIFYINAFSAGLVGGALIGLAYALAGRWKR